MSADITRVLHLTCQCSVGVTDAKRTNKNHEISALWESNPILSSRSELLHLRSFCFQMEDFHLFQMTHSGVIHLLLKELNKTEKHNCPIKVSIPMKSS